MINTQDSKKRAGIPSNEVSNRTGRYTRNKKPQHYWGLYSGLIFSKSDINLFKVAVSV